MAANDSGIGVWDISATKSKWFGEGGGGATLVTEISLYQTRENVLNCGTLEKERRKQARYCNLKMFKERQKSSYVVLKRLARSSNLKMLMSAKIRCTW